MLSFEVTNRFSGATQFTAKIDFAEDAPRSIKLGLAVVWAIKTRVNLSEANLSGADLSLADLSEAYLSLADLRGADLSRADLSGAYLSGADLRGADLRGAYLGGANLRGADLRGAKCQFGVLAGSRPIIQIGPIGSEGGTVEAYHVDTGCFARRGSFSGSLDDFAAAVEKTHGASAFGDEYRAAISFLTVWAELQAAAAKQEAAA